MTADPYDFTRPNLPARITHTQIQTYINNQNLLAVKTHAERIHEAHRLISPQLQKFGLVVNEVRIALRMSPIVESTATGGYAISLATLLADIPTGFAVSGVAAALGTLTYISEKLTRKQRRQRLESFEAELRWYDRADSQLIAQTKLINEMLERNGL